MVNILAAEVYNETISFSVTDGDEIGTAFSTLSTPNVSPTGIDGFAYVERVIMEVSIDTLTVEVFSPGGGPRSVSASAKPRYIFDGTLDILPTLSNTSIFSEFASSGNGVVVTLSPSGTGEVNLDTYVDVPAQVGMDINVGGGQGDIEIEGNQTVDIDATMTFIGRTP